MSATQALPAIPPGTRSGSNNSQATSLSTGILIIYAIAVWLSVHYYKGVEHDAIFYAGQALARLYPEAFRHDLFFAFGSQDNYTLFTPAFSALLKILPLGDAALLLVFLAHIGWVTAAFFFIRRLFPIQSPAAWLALTLVLGAFPGWGPQSAFSYGEGYITARVWAECFALAALTLMLHGRLAFAVAWAAASVTMHPIIGLPAAAFVAFFGFHQRHWFAAAVLAVPAVGMAVAAGVVSVAQLTSAMDQQWYEIVANRATYVILTYWPDGEINRALCYFAAILTAAIAAEGGMRRVWLTALTVGTLFMGLAVVAGLTHHTLLLQMQTWRVLWIIRIFAILATVWLAFDFWPRGRFHRLLLLWLAIGWWAQDYWGGIVALAVPALLTFARTAAAPVVPQTVVWASCLAALVLGGNALLAELQQTQLLVYRIILTEPPSRAPAAQAHVVFLTVGSLIFSVLLWPIWHMAHGSRRWQATGFATVVTLALIAALNWNQRSPYERDITSNLARATDPIMDFFPPNGLIYWLNNYRVPWFVLHRGNYASGPQTAGLVFARGTAIESVRRIERLALLGTADAGISWTGRYGPMRANKPIFGALVHLCHDPVLDFVVHDKEFSEAKPAVFPQNEHYTYYVYDCRRIRQTFSDPFHE